ncbi:MAG TPA: hypothetical protein VIU93_03385 [Gallionellaceae bacterium]
MGFFSNLFKKSSFFSSEYTDKSMMSLAEVINAHNNWKTRFAKFMDGTLGYSLDPEILAAADDTELGRWILQMDDAESNADKRKLLDQLHQANADMHIAASGIAKLVVAGDTSQISKANVPYMFFSRQVMTLLKELEKRS